jgi:hypothetical protein
MSTHAQAVCDFEMNLEIKLFTLGERHPDTVRAYIHLGDAYEKIDSHEKAQIYKRKALQIKESTHNLSLTSVKIDQKD